MDTRALWRRRLRLGGVAAVLAMGFIAVFATLLPATSIAVKCPPGESEDLFTGVCVPELSPSIVEMTTAVFDGVPRIDGVPCTGHNSYECIGLAEEQQAVGPTPTPHSTETSSP
jgi:hypothetical protein